MNDEKQVFRNIWVMAHKQNRAIELDCGNKEAAIQMRFSMYRAARPFKLNPTKDVEFSAAMGACQVTVSGSVLTCEPRMLTSTMQNILEQLKAQGVVEPTIQEIIEKDEVAESLERLRNLIEPEAQPAKRTNPYYTRD